MIDKAKRPDFPPLFKGARPVWGQGNSLMSLQLLASIPLYTLMDENDPERKKSYNAYWEQKNKEYEDMKALYNEVCYVGTVWKGNTGASAKITKVFISDDKAYVCYIASDAHKKEIEEMNRNSTMQYKPIKSGKFSLHAFLSAIKSQTIQIISVPDQMNFK